MWMSVEAGWARRKCHHPRHAVSFPWLCIKHGSSCYLKSLGGRSPQGGGEAPRGRGAKPRVDIFNFYFLDLFIFFYNMSSYHNVLFSYFLHSWARESGSGFEAAARSPPGPGPPPLCGLGLGLGPRNVENMKRA